MGRENAKYWMLFIFTLGLLSLSVHSVHAKDDELYLTGIIKSVNQTSGIVFVDVISSSCPGIRKFSMDDAAELTSLVNKKIDFFIDSPSCRDEGIHKMFPYQRGRR